MSPNTCLVSLLIFSGCVLLVQAQTCAPGCTCTCPGPPPPPAPPPSPTPSPSPSPSPAPSTGTTYYVNSATGSDNNNGLSSTKAWKTITKVNNFGWSPGFKPGDRILLSGTFTNAMWFQLDKTYGSAANPITISSQNAATPATLNIAGDTAILFYSMSNAAPGLGFKVTNLILKGNGALNSKGKTVSGIMVWHDHPQAIEYLYVDNVQASGFSSAGIETGRNTGQGYIKSVTVVNSVGFSNPGYPNVGHPSGSGIVLGGVQGALIQNCTAYSNGAAQTNQGGPVGIWSWDSDQVVIRYCKSYSNTVKSGQDGGGYDLDGGVTNSIIEYCDSWNNYGYGYLACTYTGYANNRNITIRHSTTTNDTWGAQKVAYNQVYVHPGTTLSDVTFENITTRINAANCNLWTNAGSAGYPAALGFDPVGTGTWSNIVWKNNNVYCNDVLKYTQNLSCASSKNPVCS